MENKKWHACLILSIFPIRISFSNAFTLGLIFLSLCSDSFFQFSVHRSYFNLFPFFAIHKSLCWCFGKDLAYELNGRNMRTVALIPIYVSNSKRILMKNENYTNLTETDKWKIYKRMKWPTWKMERLKKYGQNIHFV